MSADPIAASLADVQSDFTAIGASLTTIATDTAEIAKILASGVPPTAADIALAESVASAADSLAKQATAAATALTTVATPTPSGPTPVVTGILPTGGPVAGGTSVNISGSGFTGATGVKFGSVPATSVVVVSDVDVSCVAPAAAAAGPVDVVVTGPGGSSAVVAADQYTYS